MLSRATKTPGQYLLNTRVRHYAARTGQYLTCDQYNGGVIGQEEWQTENDQCVHPMGFIYSEK